MRAFAWLLAIFAIAGCTAPVSQPPKALPVPTAELAPKPLPLRKLMLADLAPLSPAAMTQVFGAPSLDRREGDVRVLQFTSGSCISDLVFNAAGNLVHVEARAKSGTPIEIQPCIDSFDTVLPETLAGS
ncbi:MAG: hypothetical protein AAF221_03590 [Pseudomonadota bacterium]